MAMNVTNKTAIVTGAGSGINLSFAKLLLSKGCNVIFADLALRPEAKLVVDEYSAGNGGARAVFIQTDVVNWAQLGNLFDVAEKEFGNADIVVPGAGIFEPPFSNFWQPPNASNSASRDSIERSSYTLVDININHPIRTTQLAIAHFLKHNKPGVVVHISSIAGQTANLGCPMYAASKHALNGFIRSLTALETPYSVGYTGHWKVTDQVTQSQGRELPAIRVNGVAPGIIKTPLWTDHPEKFVMATELDDWVTPEEVAEVMLSCIQDEDIHGGSIIEVAGNGTRKVEAFMDPGPVLQGRHPKFAPNKLTEGVWNSLGSEGWGQ